MTITVVNSPLFNPPRAEITVAVPTGNVMQNASLVRIVNGLVTPTRSQPSTGFDTRIVYDYECPYDATVTYEFTADYTDSSALTTVWDETWPNLSNWTGNTASYSVGSGLISLSTGSPGSAIISRTITPGSYRAVISSVAVSGTDILSAQSAGVAFVNGAGKIVVKIIPNLDGTVSVSSGVKALAATATGISGTAPITVDFLGTSVVVSGTSGSYTISHVSDTDFTHVEVMSTFHNPGTFSVGEVIVSSYGSTSHIDQTSVPGVLSPAGAWLIHPSNPSLSIPVSSTDRSTAAIRSIGDVTNASAVTSHPILGQSEPITTTSGPRFSNQLSIVIGTRTTVQEKATNAILADGTPLLFRAPASFDIGFDEGFYAVGDVVRSRMSQRPGDPMRNFTLPLIEVQAPLVVVQNAGWSWAALAAAFSSWSEVAAAYNTWADVLTDNRNPGY